MAGRTVDPRVVRKLIPKNMSWRPRRGGLSRMKRNPKRASPIQEVFSRASSLGLGMGTSWTYAVLKSPDKMGLR
jgi:hypothetical protein